MTNGEVIAVCISIGALCISLATLYLSFFHKKISLIGTLASCNVPIDENVELELEYSLGNTGNQELLAREINLEVDDEGESHGVPVIEINEIPAVIRPGEIKLVRFKLPLKHFLVPLSREKKALLIFFEIHSPNGKQYRLSHRFELDVLDPENPELISSLQNNFKVFVLGKPVS